ncbi:FG-GAP-like repeat-containing protein [Hymenobacter terrenus]|uniref:FG-GAP-like repeat-containing protein n=1 Tax=Hymenobacter terrenus TaxID=1629124 RepID=UPI000619A7FC|nr:FG-GAP-like repeat-containing protein [Hymenobacter terrenus]
MFDPFELRKNSEGYFGDIDNDGDLDHFLPQVGGILYTENIGTPTQPLFAASVANPFGLQTAGLDFAGMAIGDLDGDGDLDLLLEGDFSTIGGYYENTGTATTPVFGGDGGIRAPFGLVFPRIVKGYSTIFNVDQYDSDFKPVFADLDGDRDLDLFFGAFYGDTYYFQNIGSATAPRFANIVVNPFGLGNVTRESTPAFADLDRDGDLDAFIGNRAGDVHYYRNTGSATAPAFTAAGTNPFGLTNVNNRAHIRFADLDGDGDSDAFVRGLIPIVAAPDRGALFYYENEAVPAGPARLLQRIDGFGPLPTLTTATLSYAITGVTGGASGNPIRYYSSDPTVATVSGNVILTQAPGTATILATQLGNSAYASATNVSQVLTVLDNPSKVAQTITGFGPIPLQPTVGGTYTIPAVTGGASGNPVVFTSSNPGFATVSGNVVTLVTRGEVTITATQDGNRFYAPAPPVVQPLTIGTPRLPQVITGLGPARLPDLIVGNTYTITGVTGGASGNPVTYSVSSAGDVVRASVSGNVVTALAAGTVIVQAEQLGNDDYDAASAETVPLRIIEDPAKTPQVITGIPLPIPTQRVGATYSFASATGGASGNPVVFTSSDPVHYPVSGTSVAFLAPGTVTITATQAGNSLYQTAPPVRRTFRVTFDPGKAYQNILGLGIVPDLAVGATYTLADVRGGASGNPVVLTSSDPAIVSVSGNVLTARAPGLVTITANQAGNAGYNPAPEARTDARVQAVLTTASGAAGTPMPFQVYPNPANEGQFFVEAAEPSTAVLYNALGAVVQTLPVKGKTAIRGLSPGLYILQLRNRHESLRKKVIVN